MSVVDDFGTLIQNAGFGAGIDGSGSTMILYGGLLDDPDQVIAIIVMKGQPQVRTMGRVSFEQPRVQIITRGFSRATAAQLQLLVFQALNGFHGTVNGVRYLWVESMHSPFDLGDDERGRFKCSCTYHVMKELDQ